MTQKAEKRDFRMHPELLWSVIKSQAGTVSKAFLELVMNAVDAGSDKVELTFDRDTFKVSDSGKGFASRKEIEDFFETFGTPHKEGDATFGKFRMGRGQIFSFAKNTWRSSQFQMDVDIKILGLEYDLHDNKPMINGCIISGEFYDKMTPSEVVRLNQEMEDMCKYVPIPVFCNGKRISVNVGQEKWTHDDDDAYMKLNAGMRSLSVFNRGVLVRTYPSGSYGCGGVVVSKKQLEVNFARNDILVSQCQVWKRLSAIIKMYSGAENNKSAVKNEAWRELMCAKLAGEDFESEAELSVFLDDATILTDITGKHFSIMRLINAAEQMSCKVLIEKGGNKTGMESKLHKEKFAIVIAKKSLDRFRMSYTLTDVIDVVVKCVNTNYRNSSFHANKFHKFKTLLSTVDVLMAQHGVNNDRQIIDPSVLTKPEKVMLSIIDKAVPSVWILHHAAGLDRTERKIKVIESQITDTDTSPDYIFLNRKYLTVSGNDPFGHFSKLGAKLLHEYLHDDSVGVNGHNAEFYEYFERCAGDYIGSFVASAVYRYGQAVMSGSIGKIRQAEEKIVDTLDLFSSEPESQVAALPVAATVEMPATEAVYSF